MSNNIQNLVGTTGWKEAEKIFLDEVNNLKSQDVDESLSANEYKIVSLANKKAGKVISALIKKINLIGKRHDKQNKNYK